MTTIIDKYKWLNGIQNAVREIANPEFQERVWVRGEGPEVSSFTEAICRLFDDYNFDNFLDEHWQNFGFSSKLYPMLDELRNRLNEYEEKETDAEIVRDERWDEIREFAKVVLLELDRELKAVSR
ncbi:MAG: hypothetical protein SXA11_07955 [Cyanobacteriota bacterium]|nr:hypothetical protein [Cyanobacteriota bacterium]